MANGDKEANEDKGSIRLPEPSGTRADLFRAICARRTGNQ